MANKIRSIFSDNLFRSSGRLFGAFMVASVFNYLFQIVMGRLLGPGQYGLLNALLSLLVVLSIPISTLLMAVSAKAAEYRARSDGGGISGLYSQVTRRVLKAGGAGLIVFLLCSSLIGSYLRAPSLVPVLLLGTAAFFSLLGPVNTAMLQGLQDYKWLGITMALSGPARLVFSVLPVLAGFGINGAVGGLVATGIFAWWITYAPLKKHITTPGDEERGGHLAFSRVMPIFAANLAFAVMTQADIVLVNRYFLPHEAGVYASAAILGRAVMYIPGSIVLAMFPMVSETKALNTSGRHLLFKSLLATSFFSGGGALLFYLFPEWIIGTFFGAGYLEAASLLKYFGLAMLPMAFLLVFMNYFVAREKNVFSYIMAVCAVLEIAAMHLYHSTPLDIVKALSAAGVLALLTGIAAQWAPLVPARGKGEARFNEEPI